MSEIHSLVLRSLSLSLSLSLSVSLSVSLPDLLKRYVTHYRCCKQKIFLPWSAANVVNEEIPIGAWNLFIRNNSDMSASDVPKNDVAWMVVGFVCADWYALVFALEVNN